ncbi:MAG: WbqC family protein [Lentisphaerae bacterium]|nr:WbqC family protein [Lentisphaerota bacterium]
MAIMLNYSKAPFFKTYAPLLEELYARRDEYLADFTIDMTIALSGALGIRDTTFVRSSRLGVTGTKTGRLLEILKALGADHYVAGASSKTYLEEDRLAQEGITFEYAPTQYPEYPQMHPPFDGFLSVIDLLFATGPEAGKYIWAT